MFAKAQTNEKFFCVRAAVQADGVSVQAQVEISKACGETKKGKG